LVTATATTLSAYQLEQGMRWTGSFFSESFQDNITANPGGGQTGAFQLTRQNNRVTTVTTAGDSIMLPPALPGLEVIVVNHGANSMQVFGNGTDTIDDVATATGVPQMQNSTTLLLHDAGQLVYRMV
jgi:hypothetical protein